MNRRVSSLRSFFIIATLGFHSALLPQTSAQELLSRCKTCTTTVIIDAQNVACILESVEQLLSLKIEPILVMNSDCHQKPQDETRLEEIRRPIDVKKNGSANRVYALSVESAICLVEKLKTVSAETGTLTLELDECA